jgi:competence protein ComEC
MRAWWCGFALGVIGLQHQAALPGWGGWCGLVLCGCGAMLIAAWGLRGGAVADAISRGGQVLFSARSRSCIGWGALWIAALCVGFGYAAWRAETRLAVSLPNAWEGRDIDVVGSIKGLPSRDDKGAPRRRSPRFHA